MSINRRNPQTLWSIILAGGEGERTRPFIEQWLGYHKPKQYCTFVGRRSMLQHTWDRADRLAPSTQKITVIAPTHRSQIWPQLGSRSAGHILMQPRNRDTAAGIFLPLTYVRAWDPTGTVVLYPSDHFVFPEDRFIETVRSAILAAESVKNRVILLGVQPDGLELDYGWIESGALLPSQSNAPLRKILGFLEKPDARQGRAALATGALWNTLVLTARVQTLWELGWQCVPDVMMLFEQLGHAIGTSAEGPTLDSIYQAMPIRNFSSDLLQQVPNRLGVMELTDVLWSDWGRPERIAETLQELAKTPAFPLESLLAEKIA